jgi:hypothetical protein
VGEEINTLSVRKENNVFDKLKKLTSVAKRIIKNIKVLFSKFLRNGLASEYYFLIN